MIRQACRAVKSKARAENITTARFLIKWLSVSVASGSHASRHERRYRFLHHYTLINDFRSQTPPQHKVTTLLFRKAVLQGTVKPVFMECYVCLKRQILVNNSI